MVVVLAAVIYRHAHALALLAVAALPFRIPISSGGTTSNLLVPLYLVIAAGVLAHGARRLRGPALAPWPRARGLEWLLMGLVGLYAVQASYSSDFMRALEQVVFFYVPFALLFVLLCSLDWEPRLVVACLALAAALAVLLVGIGFLEYSRRELLLNPRVIASNQVESYFRVNSLFFDPNIYGRFLMAVMLGLTAGLLWSVRERTTWLLAATLALLLAGLLLSFSQSSLAALLLGLAVLAAVRFSVTWTLGLTGAALVAGVAAVALAPHAFHFDVGSSQSADRATSGRSRLIRGGVDLFADRPLQGWGSGAFIRQYRAHNQVSAAGAASASHTIPITVAAEQGVIGLAVYLALLAACLGRLFDRVRSSPQRLGVAAAFAALLLHTMLYADFLEDPLTWALLGIGTVLAWRQRAGLLPASGGLTASAPAAAPAGPAAPGSGAGGPA